MTKKFVLFTIKKKVPLAQKLHKFSLNALPVAIIIAAFIMKLHYIIVVVLLFIALMLRKVFKVRAGEKIEVYYDYLIFDSHNKRLELDFYHIHHIDMDVAEWPSGKKYIKELVLLDSAEKELLSIEGERYEKEQLEFLVHRILEVHSAIIHR